MSRTITYCLAVLLAISATTFASAQDTKIEIIVKKSKVEKVVPGKAPFKGHRAAVDVAILLDTSNSMDGLISQAKSQLWTIVQQFAQAKKNGQTPMLRVALFEYGNTNLPATEGYLRQVVPLTDDLDKLSESLFALTTNGGDEYCGQVIDEAVTRLDWSKEPNGYKAIFIAGNEPFTQGSVDYRKACKRAIETGVVVNTIHCGNNSTGINGKWQDGAQIAEGEFFNIDQDRTIVHIKCPQDKIIIRLNSELNKTYLWYGKKEARGAYRLNQLAQDKNAEEAGGGAFFSRSAIKGGSLYRNSNRDLVDTLKEDDALLGKVKKEELPEELQNMTVANRKKYVKEMSAKRAEVQKELKKISEERAAYVAKERKRLAEDKGEATLGDAVVAAIQKQLTKAGFESEKEKE